MSKKLFVLAPNKRWYHNTQFGKYDFGHPNLIYLLSFSEAARTLAERALEVGGQDIYVYAILFNYRHAIEIGLKEGIRTCQQYAFSLQSLEKNDQPLTHSEPSLEPEHSLEKLYHLLDFELKNLEGLVLDDDFRLTIMQMHTLDPQGQTFRYPTDSKGKPLFLEDKWFDLANAKDKLDQCCGFLTAIIDWMSEQHRQLLELYNERAKTIPSLDALDDLSMPY